MFEKIKEFLSYRKNIVSYFFIFLFSYCLLYYLPLLLFVDKFSLGMKDLVGTFFFAGALFVIPVFLSGLRRFFLFVFWLITVIPVLVASAYAAVYSVAIDSEHLYFIWETNTNEAGEFIQYLLNVGMGKLLVILIILLFNIVSLVFFMSNLNKIRKNSFFSSLPALLFCFLCLKMIFSLGFLSQNNTIVFYNSFFDYNIQSADIISFTNKSALDIKNIEVKNTLLGGSGEVYVVVIGESASRHHMSLYGYERSTDVQMKKLDREGELLVYGNVISRFTGTTNSLLHALSFKDPQSSFDTFRYSIVDVFKQAGFKTYWISNNAVMPRKEALLRTIWGNADEIYFVPPKKMDMMTMAGYYADTRDPAVKANIIYDDALFPRFQKILEQEEKRKVIFVHLRGSHNTYWYRFPEKFNNFRDSSGIPPKKFELSDEVISVTNDYDNSIFYTDYILSQLIAKLKATRRPSWLLYFSDHGEEVFDNRLSYGRQTDLDKVTKYMMDIPFFVWFSEGFPSKRAIKDLKKESNRPFSLDGLIHSIMDLAQLQTALLNEKKSVFSASYEIPKRYYQEPSMQIKQERPYLEIPPLELYNSLTVSDEIKAFKK